MTKGEDAAFVRGFVMAATQMSWGGGISVQTVCRAAHITLDIARKSGVTDDDIDRLKKQGVA